eukprot:ctg_20.g4
MPCCKPPRNAQPAVGTHRDDGDRNVLQPPAFTHSTHLVHLCHPARIHGDGGGAGCGGVVGLSAGGGPSAVGAAAGGAGVGAPARRVAIRHRTSAARVGCADGLVDAVALDGATDFRHGGGRVERRPRSRRPLGPRAAVAQCHPNGVAEYQGQVSAAGL